MYSDWLPATGKETSSAWAGLKGSKEHMGGHQRSRVYCWNGFPCCGLVNWTVWESTETAAHVWWKAPQWTLSQHYVLSPFQWDVWTVLSIKDRHGISLNSACLVKNKTHEKTSLSSSHRWFTLYFQYDQTWCASSFLDWIRYWLGIWRHLGVEEHVVRNMERKKAKCILMNHITAKCIIL